MLRKKRGIAMIEFLFFFFVFIFFFALMYGSWGITHSAILHSIGARAYAWDVIRNRSNLAFLRDYLLAGNLPDTILQHNYWQKNSRVFAVTEVRTSGNDFLPQKLKIDMGGAAWNTTSTQGFTKIDVQDRRSGYDDRLSTYEDPNNPLALTKPNPRGGYKTGVVHLKMAYGICLNSNCDAN